MDHRLIYASGAEDYDRLVSAEDAAGCLREHRVRTFVVTATAIVKLPAGSRA